MYRYFQRLIRRAFGEFHKHTIQPSIRIQGNFYDPFEKTVVRPLQYPESQTSRPYAIENHKERGLSERKLQKISKHTFPSIGPPEVSPKTSFKRVDMGAISSSNNHKNVMQLRSEPVIRSDPTRTKTEKQEQRFGKNDPQISLRNIEPPTAESVKQKKGASGKRNYRKLTGQTYFKTVVSKSDKPSTAVGHLFRKSGEKTGDTERTTVKHANRYVPPKRIEPIPKPSFTTTTLLPSNRRSSTRTGKENRLSIGNLVVDVVPVSETSRKRSSSRGWKAKVQRQSKSSLSRQIGNLSFGLGQM